jgi:hypothetical protein
VSFLILSGIILIGDISYESGEQTSAYRGGAASLGRDRSHVLP